ncbi:BTB/POZ and MATH domain-containing protein 2-like [Panicum miliaceum]|uniref:BTB/POZ and MATH domain-containing protein 2-like n=1 Tax=Panicum miliaceum TaxID=4540 RepID=A0A3L6RJE7_PANMI|nr:BTB/POZ and MATH domain-containing protein 2-like [Panicum miliaceum]
MRTKSRCTPQTACGTHALEIVRYSLHKGLGKGKFIQSAAFAVGGYKWCIVFFPDGNGRDESTGYVSVYLKLLSQKAKVRASYDFRLVDQTTGSSSMIMCSKVQDVYDFDTTVSIGEFDRAGWGHVKFMKCSDLEASAFLRDDRLVIECDITVIQRSQIAKTVPAIDEVIRVPPSDLSDDFGRLLLAGEETDMTFGVKGESFAAHRNVLAARSPVFRAQLFGQVGVDNRNFITIEDVEPGIFKALLHFIYTDSLPDIGDIDLDEIHEDEDIVKHLLVAADKYAMERLRLLCASILCKNLDEKTVATTLALADLHNCRELREACIEYIVSSDRVAEVAASPGYQHLKTACPAIFLDIWEKAARLV